MNLATKAQGIWLIVLILLIGILGVLMLAGLAAARSRFQARLKAHGKPAGAPQDLWKISGERFSTDNGPSPAGNDTTDDDEENPNDEDSLQTR